jgi:phage minor structural protein
LQTRNSGHANGIDVSKFQGTINWASVASDTQHIRFAWARASQGLTINDTQFANNVKGARANGILIGAYHFANPDTNTGLADARAEADHFIEQLQQAFPTSDYGDLYPVLDLEEPSPIVGAWNATNLMDWANAFREQFESRTNKKLMLYMSSNFASSYASFNYPTGNRIHDMPLWWAAYATTKPADVAGWEQWDAWQYTNAGSVNGITGAVDIDVAPALLNLLSEPAGPFSERAEIYILDGQSENVDAVLSNRGNACPFWDAVHLEQLNGKNELRFSIPANHSDAQYVIEGNQVAFRDFEGEFQVFEIRLVENIHGDTLIKRVRCEHVMYELNDEFIQFSFLRNTNVGASLNSVLSGTRWSVGRVDPSTHTASIKFELASVLESVSAIGIEFERDWRFRVKMEDNTISHRYVDMIDQRGADAGRRFEYGKDVKEIERDVDVYGLKTAVWGYGKAQQLEEGISRIKFTDLTWSTAAGDPISKPVGQNWVGSSSAKANWGRSGGTRHRFGVFEDPDITDEEELLQKTYEHLLTVKDPRIEYRMKIVDLEQIIGVARDRIRLGDTINVIDNEFVPALQLETRIVEIKRNLVDPDKSKVTLDNLVRFITDDAFKLDGVETRVHNNQGSWQGNAFGGNMINDHSFELLRPDGDTAFPDNNQQFQVDFTNPNYGNAFYWYWGPTSDPSSTPGPLFISTWDSGAFQYSLFDFQAVVVSSCAHPKQQSFTHLGVGFDGPYTASAYIASYGGTTAIGTTAPGLAKIAIYAVEGSKRLPLASPTPQASATIQLTTDTYTWKRIQCTARNLPTCTDTIEVALSQSTATPNFKYLADGVQLVPVDEPITYEPDSSVWYHLRNFTPGFELNNAGVVDGTFIVNGAYVRARQSTDQAFAAATATKVNYKTEQEDINDNWDTTTSTFTAPTRGRYLIIASIRWPATQLDQNLTYLSVVVDGTERYRIYQGATGRATNTHASGSCWLSLDKGDVVEIRAYTLGALSSVATASGSWVEIIQLTNAGTTTY